MLVEVVVELIPQLLAAVLVVQVAVVQAAIMLLELLAQ
jgi:hypothetical protein